MRSGVLVQETSDNNIPKRKNFLISKSEFTSLVYPKSIRCLSSRIISEVIEMVTFS